MKEKTVEGTINFIGDMTGTNADMDFNIHKGFTIGNGKTLYWNIIWHKSGHCTVYRVDGNKLISRYIKGDTKITLHFL